MDSIEGIDRMNPTINRWRAMHMFDQEKTGKCRVLQPESGGKCHGADENEQNV